MALKLIFLFLHLYLLTSNHEVDAVVTAVNVLTNQTDSFEDSEATFGTAIGEDGFVGVLVLADPVLACDPIAHAPNINDTFFSNITTNTIALIKRGPKEKPCGFSTKVFYAQLAKFDAAIVYNDVSNELTQMGSGSHADEINIPSVFVGLSDGLFLRNFFLYDNNETKAYIRITKESNSFDLKVYLIPFCTVIATCFFCLTVFMVVRCVQGRRRRIRNRLSRRRLKQLPTKQFCKADEYDVCAICLDEYEEGEELRILPCKHAYHCHCVDPWLTTSKRVCPLCKRRVLSDDESSNSEDETDDDTVTSEDAPLLRDAAAASPNASRYATGFSRINPFTRSYSSTTEESVEQASLRSDPFFASRVVEERSTAADSELTPEFYSLRDDTPHQLIVLADVPPVDPNVSSSVVSVESIEAYSCKSASSSDGETVANEDESPVLILRGRPDNPTCEANSTDA